MTIYVFLIWTAVALAWYFFYGIRHATLGKPKPPAVPESTS